MKPNGDYEHDTSLLRAGCGMLIIIIVLIIIGGVALLIGPY